MNYRVTLQDLPISIKAFTKETDGFYNIVLNARLSADRQRKAYYEEIHHIINNDFDRDCSADQIEANSHGKE